MFVLGFSAHGAKKEGFGWLSGDWRNRDLYNSPIPPPTLLFSLLGEGDLHGVGRGDLEALEGVPGGRGLHLGLELHEGDVVAAGDQADLVGEK